MNVLVPQKLRDIEQQYKVTVLYAAESGSRAWGFASPDSDFDVRFIYKRPREDYLRLDPPRDVIELPVDETWDVVGWDLDKTLRLLHKSNPGLYEWLGSPVLFSALAEAELPAALREPVAGLLEQKTHGPEALEIPHIEPLDA